MHLVEVISTVLCVLLLKSFSHIPLCMIGQWHLLDYFAVANHGARYCFSMGNCVTGVRQCTSATFDIATCTFSWWLYVAVWNATAMCSLAVLSRCKAWPVVLLTATTKKRFSFCSQADFMILLCRRRCRLCIRRSRGRSWSCTRRPTRSFALPTAGATRS